MAGLLGEASCITFCPRSVALTLVQPLVVANNNNNNNNNNNSNSNVSRAPRRGRLRCPVRPVGQGIEVSDSIYFDF